MVAIHQVAYLAVKGLISYSFVSAPSYGQSIQRQILWAENTPKLVHHAKITVSESHSQLGTL